MAVPKFKEGAPFDAAFLKKMFSPTRDSLLTQIEKQMALGLMYGASNPAILRTVHPDAPPAPNKRYRLIVEMEITATSDMAARNKAKRRAFSDGSLGAGDIITVLMCEPILGPDETKV